MTWVLFVSASIWYASTQIKLKEVGQIKIKYTLAQLLGRALFSGVIISFGVIMSKLAGPVWGGVMSTFPALTIASFLITIRTGGLEFTRHLARNILISTTINIVLYAMVVRFTYLSYGVFWGTLLAYTATLGFTLLLNKVVKK